MSTYDSKTVAELKEIAERRGVKRAGVGWAKCCPPDGNRDAIIAALRRLNGSSSGGGSSSSGSSGGDLRSLTLVALKTLAEDLGVKSEGVGWATCCPPAGNKDDVVRAIQGFQARQRQPATPGALASLMGNLALRVGAPARPIAAPAKTPGIPAHWSGQFAGAAGFAVFSVPTDHFAQLLSVPDPENLGVGRDVPHGDPWKGSFPGKSLHLAQAWRVENPQLWTQYVAARDAVRSQLEQVKRRGVSVPTLRTELHPKTRAMPRDETVDASINELFLLHGTKPDALVSVLTNGPSDKFSDGLFGQGVYLAENACKNDQYVTKDSTYGGVLRELHGHLYAHGVQHPQMPVYYLILCRVVMGVPVSTRDGQTDAAGASIWSMPDRELSTIGGTSTFYHSLVAEAGQGAQYTLHRHREFLQYHQNRIYPAYVLAYHRLIDQGGGRAAAV